MPFKEDFHHHHHRRKHDHDYCAPWKYHITILKAQGCESFSHLKIKELTPDGVVTIFTPLGSLIWHAIKSIQNDRLRIYRFSIMPDHIHLLIHATKRLPQHLGFYIATLKAQVTSEWRQQKEDQDAQIFQENYNDRIILPEHNLDDVYQYIRQNPYRLAIRQTKPEFFKKKRNIFINDREIQAYGNLFLLRNPFKISLVIHRADSEQTFQKKKEECLYYALNGGVIVSAFISPREKEIRKAIEEVGGKIILIHNQPLADRAKPERRKFNLCIEGKLLMISPIDYLEAPQTEHPSRAQCLDMNKLAEAIAGNSQIKNKPDKQAPIELE